LEEKNLSSKAESEKGEGREIANIDGLSITKNLSSASSYNIRRGKIHACPAREIKKKKEGLLITRSSPSQNGGGKGRQGFA